MTTTTVIGVTGSFHTTTFHGRSVTTRTSLSTSLSVDEFRSGADVTPPVSQTKGLIGRSAS